ncbi:uncharacterized protein LOC128721211 [Anopheles nili]|uniref:uncharacterized protein LOC128721211 n=1 Tax=Anopheles nili TaxID=185578 RepID=UPI00237AC38D|nr:uncharacterized protein LOC128721211 [Anopheles nili]
MSFGPPRKPTGPPRQARLGVVKKTVSKTVPSSNAPKAQQAAKTKPAPVVATSAPKKTATAAPKPIPAPKPPTPDPVYDYESDFESDESVPSGRSSSSESSVENVESNGSSSEGGDDEDEGEPEANAGSVEETGVPTNPVAMVVETQRRPVNPRTTRSVDILSKISLNDISMELYKFDPEEYAELRTNFGVTSTVVHGKHIQTDCSVVSIASQTSGIAVRSRSTCMHEGFRYSPIEEEHSIDRVEEDDDDSSVQNYSSLQNIERMFSTLNGALERRFSKATVVRKQGPLSIAAAPETTRKRNQQRSILQLVRKVAPTFDALLESRHFRSENNKNASGANVPDTPMHTREQFSNVGRTPLPEVVRSFNAGKMSPEFEIKLKHNTDVERSEQADTFVLEFWARGTYSRPMYRFGSWCSIVCVDYESHKHMMVFGGTSDGTLQMWLGDAGRCRNEVLAPHQIVAPTVKQKYKLSCWEMVTVKVLPVPVVRDSALDAGTANAFNQVFGLFSSGIIIVWDVHVENRSNISDALNATLGTSSVLLVQSKVIDLSSRIGSRMPYDTLRSFENLLLHDHHQMVLSSNHTVIRLSHFVQSEYDPVLLVQPDDSNSILNLKRMVQANDTLFALYSNKTVHVLKLCAELDNGYSSRNQLHQHDDQPSLMLNVCTNKSCTIQSIVHDEAKRYGNSSGAGESRADGGSIATKVNDVENRDEHALAKPRFHHGQQILFFEAQHPEGILNDVKIGDRPTVSY